MEKCLLCFSLFCLASWIACVASKVLSTHFYKSTHFKKFKEALNREYILHVCCPPADDNGGNHDGGGSSGTVQ